MNSTGLIILAISIAVLVVVFWLPMLKTRKARGLRMPAAAGMPAGRVVAYFSSSHCGNCRSVSPLIDALEQQGQTVVRFNAEQALDIAGELGIRVVPTVALVDDGVIVSILAGDKARKVARLNESDWLPSTD
jgi:thiol-disulfide isomerase/thioredoxin